MRERRPSNDGLRSLTALADAERSAPTLRSVRSRTRLPTPDAGRSVDLLLPKIPLRQSQSLSALAGGANARQARVQRQLDEAVAWEQEHVRSMKRQATAVTMAAAHWHHHDHTKTSSTAKLPAVLGPGRFNELADEVTHLLSTSTAARLAKARDAAAAATAAPVEAEPPKPSATDEAKKKEAARKKRASELSQMLAASSHGQNKTRLEINEKLEDLRADAEARADFDRYCSTLREKPQLDIVDANVARVAGLVPEAWHATQQKRLEHSRARRTELRARQEAQRRDEAEASAAAMHAKMQRRALERSVGRERARVLGLQGQCARWLVLATLAQSARTIEGMVVEGRRRRELERRQQAAALRVQRLWRATLISVRLRKIMRGIAAMKRGVFWWRMRRRIVNKRRGTEVLLSYLRSLASASNSYFSQRVKLFKYQVVKMQRAWRRRSLVINAQVKVVLACWGANDFRKRGRPLPPGQTQLEPPQLAHEVTERLRGEIVAEDLRRRRREHVRRLDEWRRRVDDADAIAALDELMKLAKGLFEAPAIIMQRHARGRLIREATKGKGKMLGLAEGAAALPPPLLPKSPPRSKPVSKSVSRKPSAPSETDLRRPRFRLLPNKEELAKLDARLKARQRAVLMGQGGSSAEALSPSP